MVDKARAHAKWYAIINMLSGDYPITEEQKIKLCEYAENLSVANNLLPFGHESKCAFPVDLTTMVKLIHFNPDKIFLFKPVKHNASITFSEVPKEGTDPYMYLQQLEVDTVLKFIDSVTTTLMNGTGLNTSRLITKIGFSEGNIENLFNNDSKYEITFSYELF